MGIMAKLCMITCAWTSKFGTVHEGFGWILGQPRMCRKMGYELMEWVGWFNDGWE